jgi:hypothetical protein
MLSVMLTNSALLLLSRCAGIALLIMEGSGRYFWIFAAEMFFYHLQKLVRHDYTYIVPTSRGLTIPFSFLHRTIVKVIADFTACPALRHPEELGGLYFTLNMLITVAIPFICAAAYQRRRERGGSEAADIFEATEADDGAAAGVDDMGAPGSGFDDSVIAALPFLSGNGVYWFVGSLCGSWTIVFALFVALMKPGYRHTFFSFHTANAEICRVFLEGKDDEEKMCIFDYHEDKWIAIRGQVKLFVRTYWWRWEKTHPKWFNDHFRHSVPMDFVPHERVSAVSSNRARRKSSVSSINLLIRRNAPIGVDG